ncbi:hypothetical protein HAX54_052813 [Datura stramonium]|uniref:LOB domain-containing protein n=1 Tax=Datura stramonium TaxID=4076 RepID=A0ABS8WNT9_DATST|nr:hypothetical protein [Datura stramonium]
MTNIVTNTQNIFSPAPSSSLTTAPSGLRTNTTTTTTTTRVASRGGSGGCSGNGSQACAACKYQRRRCAPDCPLAPYFPVERQKDFLNAHKLFGVSNILKVLKNIAPFQKDNAMKALIFEANIRASDPVGGCYRLILNLYRQINLYQEELQFVYREIFCAVAMQQQQNINMTACSVHDLHRLNRSNSIYIGEASTSQMLKGKGIQSFSSDEEFETKTIKSSLSDKQFEFETKTIKSSLSNKQLFDEHEDIKPYLGNFHDYKGKGVLRCVK